MEKNDTESNTKFLKKCDLFENPITLSYEGHFFYKTKLGGFLTFLDIIVILGYFILNIEEILGKDNYTIYQKESYNSNNVINFTSVPFAFKLTTLNGTDISYDPKIFTYKIVRLSSKNSLYEENEIEFETCKKYFQYNENYYYLKKYNSESLMCIKPNENLEMKGIFEDSLNEFEGFKIYIIKCNQENCFRDKAEILNDIKFNFYFLGYSLNHDSYFNSILINNLYSYSVNFPQDYIKKYTFNFKSGTYNYYTGKFYNRINTKYFFLYDGYTSDIEKTNGTNIIVSFSFHNKGINIEYTKKGENLWSLIDKIGGLMYVIITITKIINNFISRKILCVDLYQKLDRKEYTKNTNYLDCKWNEKNNMGSSIENYRKRNLILNNSKENNNAQDKSSDNFKNFQTALLKSNKLNIKHNIDYNHNNNNQKSKFGSCIFKYNAHLIGNNLINIEKKKKKKEIIKKHLYFYYMCPNCIIEKTKTFDYLSKIQKNIYQYYSIENFTKLVELEKNLKNNPSRCSSYLNNLII